MNNKELKNLCVRDGVSVKAAMKQMDTAGLKILFVVDKKERFLGTLTDGDFRRWHLAGRDLNSDIRNLYNKNPVKFSTKYDMEKVKRAMVESRLDMAAATAKDPASTKL